MEIKEIKLEQNRVKTHSVYDITFDDGFTAKIGNSVKRNMGHTAYREFEASYAQGDEALGTTYICDVGKGSRPKDDENTVAGENLATVIAHLEAVRDNSKVKQQSYPQQPFHDLTRAIPRLLRVYESEQSCYTRRVEQQEGPPTQTFKF